MNKYILFIIGIFTILSCTKDDDYIEEYAFCVEGTGKFGHLVEFVFSDKADGAYMSNENSYFTTAVGEQCVLPMWYKNGKQVPDGEGFAHVGLLVYAPPIAGYKFIKWQSNAKRDGISSLFSNPMGVTKDYTSQTRPGFVYSVEPVYEKRE